MLLLVVLPPPLPPPLLLFSTLLRPLGSLGGFDSPAERGQLAGGAISGVPGGTPFGLLEAEEGGRGFPFSAGP
jgi:hypothetical protein